VRAIALSAPLEEPFADPLYAFPARSSVLAIVELEDGTRGYGEAAVFGGPPATTLSVLEQEIAPHYVGQNPFDVERLWESAHRRTFQHGRRGIVMAALAGVDIAVWDAMARIVERPLVDLLGAARRELRCYATGGFYSRDKDIKRLEREVASFAEDGFTAVKVKVGGATLEEDERRVRAARRVLGDAASLMIDANGALTFAEARRVARRLEDCDLHWFEEPVSVDDRRGSRALREAVDVPVAGYELETALVGFRDLIDEAAVDIVQPDVTWAGGITQARRIAAYALAWGLPVAPHCFGSAVALAASAHFLASLPNAGLLEVDGNPNLLRTELVDAPWLVPTQGTIIVSDEPGLGLTVEEETLERFAA
jgi:L-alanine-DL-glutamate epimerase-like enolase superfamily enzyme